MNIEKSAQRIVDLNAPSPELLESTLRLMREAQWAGQEDAPRRKEKHAGLRRLGFSTGAVAAVMALLIGTNALFPAFAESLPLVGSIFRQINPNGAENLRDTQENIQSYAQPLDSPEVSEPESEDAALPEAAPVLTLDVPPNADNEQALHIMVEEAYYDGYFLYAGLRMEVEKNYPEEYDRIYDYEIPGYDVVINGEGCYGWNEKGGRGADVPGFSTLGYDMWSRTGDREYICQRGFLLPEEYWNQDSLDVELVYKGLFTYNPRRSDEDDSDGYLNTSNFSLSFTARRNDAPMKEIDCGGISMNGVTMQKAIATPAGTLFVVDYETRYQNPSMGSCFADGYALGFQGGCVAQDQGNGYFRDVAVFGGLREAEDRSIVWNLYDKNGSQQVEAVFILDFNEGTIQVGSPEGMPEIANYGWWDSADEAGDSWRLEEVTVESGQGRWKVSGPTDSCHSLRFEAYQNGELLGEGESSRSESGRVTYADEGIDYWIYNGKFWIMLDPSQPVDVKVYDSDTEELLIETDITMEKW